MRHIVALNAEYNAADEASIRASNYPVLKAPTEKIHNARDGLWSRVIATLVLAQGGVLAKLAFAAQYFDPSEIEGAEKKARRGS